VDLGSGGGSAQGGEGFDTLVVTLSNETQALVLDTAAGQVRRGGSVHVSFSGFERFDIAGGLGADSLVGSAEADTLRGGGGADTLDGGAGRDLLIGGDGDDLYLVGELPDRVQESEDGGHDWLRTGVTMSLPDFVEVLELAGPLALRGYGNASDNLILGNEFDNVLRGNEGADTLAGGEGADVLDGGAGADSMAGGAGADAYIVDDAGDVVLEVDEPGASDVVRAFVSFVLPDFVERLRLDGTEAIGGTGNALANIIGGNDAANLLLGEAGDDTLVGQGGADTLAGGAGSDRMRGGEGADLFVLDTAPGHGQETILDFEVGLDRLGFAAAAFPDLGLPGQLDAALFHACSTAGTAAHRILYDAATRLLAYDGDGAGGADAVTIALVRSTGPITATDLWVV
jgi:Ca2+-binding RTX toxin-like protein